MSPRNVRLHKVSNPVGDTTVSGEAVSVRYSASSALGRLRGAEGAEQGCEQIQREREKGRGVPLRGDLTHGLQVAELDRDREPGEDVGSLRQLGRRLELTLGIDDLRAALAFRFGLL